MELLCRLMSSPWLPSLPPHILLRSFHSFLFPPLLLLCVLPVLWLPTPCFASFSFFLHFLLFAPFPVVLDFLVSYVLTPSSHFPSSDPSGPEIPSFSAHRPLPPPKVLSPKHTALCAAVHTLGLRRGLVAKAHLCPWRCLSWCVLGGGLGWWWIVSPFSQWWALYGVLPF